MKDTGGRAFPCPKAIENGHWQVGMTLRDYFAGQAVVGLLSSEADFKGDEGNILERTPKLFGFTAYEIADAMIAERSKS